MTVKVKVGPGVSTIPTTGYEIELQIAEEATVGYILDRLNVERQRIGLVFVEGRGIVTESARVKSGDTVVVLPPLAGG